MALIAVGCPVQSREWILPSWFEHVENAIGTHKPHYVFIGDPRSDPGSFAEIDRQCLRYGRDRDVVEVDEEPREDSRNWNQSRLSHMADLRNGLLKQVRKIGPDLFWSLDSDILVADETLNSALEAMEPFDAIGTKCFMSDAKSAPSYAMLLGPEKSLRRENAVGVFKVDVIMASKLMSPKAYNVDYVAHRQGEDIGWSNAARAAGCSLGWDGRVCSKHVMRPDRLTVVDERCGF